MSTHLVVELEDGHAHGRLDARVRAVEPPEDRLRVREYRWECWGSCWEYREYWEYAGSTGSTQGVLGVLGERWEYWENWEYWEYWEYAGSTGCTIEPP